LPGRVIIGGDSHTCTYGALGAFGTGVGSTDIGVSYATGKNWFRVPETFYFDANGSFAKGVYPKDLILKIIGKVGARGATYKACEFGGETIENMAIGDRLTLTNMAIEMGGKTGVIKTDKITENFLKSRGYPYTEIVPKDPDYEKIFEFDVDDLTPQLAVSPKVDNVYPVEKYEGTEVDEVFIGTCTNGRIDDLEIAARMFKGKKLSPLLKTIIVPASNEIYFEAMNRGYIKIFMDAGAMVCNPGCGPCIGRHQGVLAPGDRALTTMNRNFIGRMGSDKGEIIIASPATAAATALTGKITDPREVI
jgi:homoaconitate hydratase family protein